MILIIEKDQKIIAKAVIDKDGALSISHCDERWAKPIELLIQKINDDGPELRQCDEDNGRLTEILLTVPAGDKNYFNAIEDEFVRAEFGAKVLDEERVNLWEKVRASDTDLAFQETVLRNITLLKDDLISDITNEFEEYIK